MPNIRVRPIVVAKAKHVTSTAVYYRTYGYRC